MNDHELRRARATLLSFKTPSHRGASLVAQCVLRGDPVADAAVAPAVQWAATIWQTAVAQERPLFTMPQLADTFCFSRCTIIVILGCLGERRRARSFECWCVSRGSAWSPSTSRSGSTIEESSSLY
eukprot:34021-Pyramimonas_sp.AAC.1